jgi:hypothetical protein
VRPPTFAGLLVPATAQSQDAELRELAAKRLKARRDLQAHTLAFVTANLFLVVIWYVTGAGFFWPASRSSAGASVWRSTPGTSTRPASSDKVDAEVARLRHHSA